MGKIDTSEWKEFRIGDYFKVEYGRFHAKDELGTGTVNYITTSGFNNGITNTCEEATHQGNCITVASDGAMGASFYQEEAFTTSNIVSTLTPLPHTPLNKYNALFLCAIIFGKRAEFGWLGFKMSVDRVRNLRVKLPTTPDGAPDWAYMESYMANLETKVAESLTMLQAAKDAEKKKVDTREWGSFALGTLFNIVKGKRLTKVEMKSGKIPFIGSSALNNGCTAMIGNDKNQHPENTITVCYNGSVGETFYQDQPYIASDDVNVLYPKFTMNRQIALFIVPLIKGVSSRYDYIDKWKKEAMEADKIYLPVDKTGQPDWAYMEEYMRKVEERVKKTINTFCVIRKIKYDC